MSFGLFGDSNSNAKETTQNVSGTGKLFGNGGQNVDSGAIGVGKKGKYQESGSVDASGSKNLNTAVLGNSKINLGKGASLTITQPAAAPLTGMTSSQPIASLTATPGTAAPPTTDGTPPPTDATPATDTSTSSLWSTIQGYWAAWSTWQKIGGATVAVLVLWLIFHKRKP